MMLHYAQPSKLKTKKIVFEKIYSASDSATLEQLKELSSKRRAIEEFMNERRSITDATAREMNGGLVSHYEQEFILDQDTHIIEQYLPLLENLLFYVDAIRTSNLTALKICWSSGLTSSSFFNLSGLKFYQIDHLQFELGMTLFLYGGILRERAFEVLSTDLVQSSTFSRQAAGIYHYMARRVLPCLQPVLPSEKPAEAFTEVSTIMSLICLAEAQAAAVRRAEEKGTSLSLIAKLHNGVALFLEEAMGILSTLVKQYRDISPRLLEFISSCKSLHELKGQQYIAESLKASEKIGAAIAVLHSGLINAKKKIPREESWKSIYQKQIHDASEVLRKLEHENYVVWSQRIPSENELPFPEEIGWTKVLPVLSNMENKLQLLIRAREIKILIKRV